MASAIALRVLNQAIEDGMIRLFYNVLVFDSPNNVAEEVGVSFVIDPNITPAQFRSTFTQTIINEVANLFPGTALSPNDCIIDVVQRGN